MRPAKHLEELKADNPALLLPLQGMAWLRFQKRSYDPGLHDLAELVAKIPKPEKPGASYPPQIQQLFAWIGQLRQFAATAEQAGNRPHDELLTSLDAAVAVRGAEAERNYEEGRAHVRGESRGSISNWKAATTPCSWRGSRWNGIGWRTTPSFPSSPGRRKSLRG